MRIILLLLAFVLAGDQVATAQPVIGFAPGSPLPDTRPGDLANTDSQNKTLSTASTISGVTLSRPALPVRCSPPCPELPCGWRTTIRPAGPISAASTTAARRPRPAGEIRGFATTFYEAMHPGFVSNQMIQCIEVIGTVPFIGKTY